MLISLSTLKNALFVDIGHLSAVSHSYELYAVVIHTTGAEVYRDFREIRRFPR